MNEIVKQESPSQKMARYLDSDSVKRQFENVLKESSGSFMASIIECFSMDTKLAQCDPKDIIMEALKAASLKLPLNKSLGFSYLVPFNCKQQNGTYKMIPVFMIGYKGLTQLAIRTGNYRYINTGYIYEGQIKNYDFLSGNIELSQPDKTKEIVGYFAYIQLINGYTKFIHWTKQQIVDHAKKFSKTFGSEKSNFWKDDFDSMAKKTVLRDLLSHWGYMSVEMAQSIAKEEEVPDYGEEVLPNSQPLPEAKKEQIEAPKTEESPGF